MARSQRSTACKGESPETAEREGEGTADTILRGLMSLFGFDFMALFAGAFFFARASAIWARVRPSPSRMASLPVRVCQRRHPISQYVGTISTVSAWRPVISHAIKVVEDPANG